MPKKTLALITGLVIVTIILWIIAIQASKQQVVMRRVTACYDAYGRLISSTPQGCINYFEGK